MLKRLAVCCLEAISSDMIEHKGHTENNGKKCEENTNQSQPCVPVSK
jgi:hypothetical protein